MKYLPRITEKDKAERDMARWTRWMGIFTAVLAIVGSVQAWSFIESERAFLAPAQVRFGSNGFAANKGLQLVVSVQNGGRSPAFITKANLTLYIGAALPLDPIYQAFGDQSGGAIAAGGARELRLYEISNAEHAGHLVDSYNFGIVEKGSAHLYVFGYVEWKDDFSIFGHKRLGFCSIYDPQNTSGAGEFSDCQNAPNYVYVR